VRLTAHVVHMVGDVLNNVSVGKLDVKNYVEDID